MKNYLMVAAVGLVLMPAVARAADATPQAAAHEMVKAWEALDLDRIMRAFSDEPVLQSMMSEPIKGQATIREHLAALLKSATKLELKIKNEAVVGNTVFLERVDEFDISGHHGVTPVVGVMEIEKGKVKVWREYYDQATLLREMGVAPAK